MDGDLMVHSLISFVVVIWVVCGVIDSGWSSGYYQRKYPLLAKERYRSDQAFCLLCAFFGPLSLISTLILYRPFRGFQWK